MLESGIVAANMLESMPMEVEVGSSTLAAADDATPRTQWFADGAQLLKKLGGKKKGAVVIAALGPRVAAQPVSGTSQRINSRAYEVRRGKERYLGSVVVVRRPHDLHHRDSGAQRRSPAAAVGLRAALPGARGHRRHAARRRRRGRAVGAGLARTDAATCRPAAVRQLRRPAGGQLRNEQLRRAGHSPCRLPLRRRHRAGDRRSQRGSSRSTCPSSPPDRFHPVPPTRPDSGPGV